MMEELKLQIKKFDGKINFNLWIVDIFDILVQKGLEQATDDKRKLSDVENKTWEKIDLMTLSLIRLSLEDEVKFNILSAKSTAELWAKLNLDYTGSSLLDKLYWKRKLFRFSMKLSTTLHDHLVEIMAELQAINVDDLSEEDKTFNLTCSLPNSYEHLITTMLHGTLSKDRRTVDRVIESLKENELRRETQAAGSSLGESLAVEQAEDGGNRAQRGKLRCQHCRKMGHVKKNCWKLHGRKDGETNIVSSHCPEQI